MSDRKVVITGIGVVAPNGIDRHQFWDSLVSGRSGIRILSNINAEGFRSRMGGEVEEIPRPEELDRGRFERLGRYAQLGVAAGIQAIKDSGLAITDENRSRIGVSVGTAIGGTAEAESQRDVLRSSRRRRVNPALTFGALAPAVVPAEIARAMKLHGPIHSVTNGCASGTSAIVGAFEEIKRGYLDAMIVGGTEAPLTEVIVSSYCEMKLTSEHNEDPKRASRPFDRDRDGMVLAEGAGMFLLEDEELAIARGAHIYGRILGRGTTCDAVGVFDTDETGEYAAIAMRQALDEARVSPGDVRYLSAYGESGRKLDKKESAAVRRAFGPRSSDVAVSSIKSLTGHPLGASGALQAVAAVLAMEEGVVPPTWNYHHQDPDCDLDYVPDGPRKQELEYGLVNSFGLGGLNVTMLLGHA